MSKTNNLFQTFPRNFYRGKLFQFKCCLAAYVG